MVSIAWAENATDFVLCCIYAMDAEHLNDLIIVSTSHVLCKNIGIAQNDTAICVSNVLIHVMILQVTR